MNTVSDFLSDTGITAAIKAKYLADSEVRPLNLGVETTNRVVTLTGNVEDERLKKLAISMAESTNGVEKVKFVSGNP